MRGETVQATNKIKLVRFFQGREYPIIIEVKEDGTLRINVSKHPGSDKQLKKIVESIASEFGTTYEVEKHIGHSHTHVHDANVDKIEV